MLSVMRMYRAKPIQIMNNICKRSIFINTESTPNPQSLKFLPGEIVLPESFGTGMYFQRGDQKEIQRSPLAKSLFLVEGVNGVFFGRDFVSVTKDTEESWNALKPQVFSKILDFFAEGTPVVTDTPTISDTTILDTDDEVVALIKELLETRVRPSVQDDGGDIFYEGFDPHTGIVSVKLAGSCVGCPSSSVTLRNGVENMLKHYIPEVTGIHEVTDEEDDSAVLHFDPDPVHIPKLKPSSSLSPDSPSLSPDS
eukprot:CAMPEP_0182417844 /NCGR_PEP_ID=MMETSP1167-20130531/2284_1 /TAXON_ID=2988 /ORGANISM="Mallomonas Sp, Strain CCMP3275" /LENGTH=252 /DNA_ID=CAMNT_0024591651 /DNA_START=77 /DNA_END=831 /DNA_ORIENTATION=+